MAFPRSKLAAVCAPNMALQPPRWPRFRSGRPLRLLRLAAEHARLVGGQR